MKIRKFISGSMLLFAMLACVIPGLNQTPPLDKNNLSTIIASTANAAMTQTAAAAPPVPAETELPTSEVVGTPEVTGTLENLPNESTQFTDAESGFVVVFPKGWLTVRPNSEEFNSALEKEAARNEVLRDQMEMDLADYEPVLDRLYSYPLLPEIEKNVMFGASILQWELENTTPINESSVGAFIDVFEDSGSIPGFRTDTATFYENGNHVNMIEIGGIFSINDGQGGFIPFYVTAIFFKPAHNGVVMMLFTYLKDFKLEIYSDISSVIQSVELVDQ